MKKTKIIIGTILLLLTIIAFIYINIFLRHEPLKEISEKTKADGIHKTKEINKEGYGSILNQMYLNDKSIYNETILLTEEIICYNMTHVNPIKRRHYCIKKDEYNTEEFGYTRRELIVK